MGRHPRSDTPAGSPVQVRMTPAEREAVRELRRRWGLASDAEAVRRAVALAVAAVAL